MVHVLRRSRHKLRCAGAVFIRCAAVDSRVVRRRDDPRYRRRALRGTRDTARGTVETRLARPARCRGAGQWPPPPCPSSVVGFSDQTMPMLPTKCENCWATTPTRPFGESRPSPDLSVVTNSFGTDEVTDRDCASRLGAAAAQCPHCQLPLPPRGGQQDGHYHTANPEDIGDETSRERYGSIPPTAIV